MAQATLDKSHKLTGKLCKVGNRAKKLAKVIGVYVIDGAYFRNGRRIRHERCACIEWVESKRKQTVRLSSIRLLTPLEALAAQAE